MAKFLDTAAISHHLQQLIYKSKKELFLVSPYLKINQRVKELTLEKNKSGMKAVLVYGKKPELQPEEHDFLNSLENFRIMFCENLHSKCYLSENVAIVTSMNLYSFSEVNNREMGILIKNNFYERSVYNDIYKEVQRTIESSDEVKPLGKVASNEVKPSGYDFVSNVEKKPVTPLRDRSA